MAAIITSGTADASSADIAVAAGAVTTLSLFWTTQPASVNVVIEIKGSNGAYIPVAELTVPKPALSIVSPGTYRVRRIAAQNQPSNAVAYGVDQT